MKRTVLAVGLASLGGCAAVPPMYPVFDAASDTKTSSPFVMRETLPEEPAKDGAAKKPERVVAISDLPRTVSKLYEQRAAYQNQADRAQKALYQTGDGVMVGAVVGAVGGIVSNVATAASGAGIATVSGLMGSRYDLAAQRNIYNDGARKVSCIITTATGSPDRPNCWEWRPTGPIRGAGTSPMPRSRRRRRPVPGPQPARTLSPPPINPAAVIALYKGLLAVPDAKGIMETQALSAEKNRAGSMCW